MNEKSSDRSHKKSATSEDVKKKNLKEEKRYENASETRGKRMVELLNGSKGMDLGKLPVPPLTKWLNGRILNAKRGEVSVKFKVRPEMANPTDLLHGGMHCAMMDDTLGITCSTLGYKGFLITIDFHVDYLGKVKVGKTVKCTGKIVREGRNIVHAEAKLFNENDSCVSTANANLLITQHKPDYNKLVDG